jgi:hypothetical protein
VGDLVRRPQPGDLVRWGAHNWRIRGLIVAPAPSVTLGIIGRRDSLRVDPQLWAKAVWRETPGRWVLPDERPGAA